MEPQWKSTFHREYHLATLPHKNESFERVLGQHAAVMVDGAKPNLEKSQYVKIGTRLGNVQQRWGRLFISPATPALPGAGPVEMNAPKYHTIVNNVIVTFTNALMEMLMEQKYIPYETLTSSGIDDLHSSKLCTRGASQLQQMRKLFHGYIDALRIMYGAQSEKDYHLAALDCFATAQALGAWLDFTI